MDGRYESDLTAVDPVTLEIRKSLHLAYPNYSGTLATAGGLVFLALLDGTVAAFADTTLDRRAPDDIRGQRQAICRDRVGTKPSLPEQTCPHAGTQGAAQRDGTVCLRLIGPHAFDCFICSWIGRGDPRR